MGFNYFCKHIQERSRWPSSTDIEKYCMVWPVTFLQIQKCALKPLFYNHRLSIDVNGRDCLLRLSCPLLLLRQRKRLKKNWNLREQLRMVQQLHKFKIVLQVSYRKNLICCRFLFFLGCTCNRDNVNHRLKTLLQVSGGFACLYMEQLQPLQLVIDAVADVI